MEGGNDYLASLTQALERRRDQISQRELPKLKELFRIFHATFRSIYEILIRKGIIGEDPYRGDQKISEIQTPSNDPFIDSEREHVLTVRLSEFDGLLEFLNNYYEFSLEFLTFSRLKDLANLVRYIQWDQLSQTAHSATTRGLAELLNKARQGTDNLSTGLINDSLQQLERNSREILGLLKTITTFHRERFKRDLREKVLPKVPDRSSLQPDTTDSIKAVKRVYGAAEMQDPFVPELVSEVLREENTPEAEHLRAQVLERLNVAEKKRTLGPGRESMREALEEAVRALGRASRPLDTSVERLVENAEILASRKRGFMERLKTWIDKMTNKHEADRVYSVRYVDETTGSTQTEAIQFTPLIARISKKARLYGAILAKSGTAWKKVTSAGDEQLSAFINREIGECQITHRRLHALDAYFKESATPEERRRMKGIKIELTSLKNSIVKANQLLHEYNARKEEYEQMKKLGVAE
jgi:hypothetical protein